MIIDCLKKAKIGDEITIRWKHNIRLTQLPFAVPVVAYWRGYPVVGSNDCFKLELAKRYFDSIDLNDLCFLYYSVVHEDYFEIIKIKKCVDNVERSNPKLP